MSRYKLYIIPFKFWYFEPLFATCGHIWRADPNVPQGCRYFSCLSLQTHSSKSKSQKNRSSYPGLIHVATPFNAQAGAHASRAQKGKRRVALPRPPSPLSNLTIFIFQIYGTYYISTAHRNHTLQIAVTSFKLHELRSNFLQSINKYIYINNLEHF